MLEIVNEDIFVPVTDKKVARDYFGLSNVDKKIIFIGATFLDEERKGMKELLLSLKYLKSKNIFFIIAGTKLKGSFPFEYKYVGYLNQKDLVKAYQAADLFICPSLEDSGPLMINQSIMCGTPVVSFDMGSAQDILQTGQTGYKANFNDISDLAYGVDYILSLNKIEYEVMSNTCRKTAEAAYSRNVFKGIVSDLLVDK